MTVEKGDMCILLGDRGEEDVYHHLSRYAVEAVPIHGQHYLYRLQEVAVEGVAEAIRQQAERGRRLCVGGRGHERLAGERESAKAHPHHAFLLNGKRGSGKTSTLLTLESRLRALSDRQASGLRILPLKILIPNAIDDRESAMEAVLSEIDQVIERCLTRAPSPDPYDRPSVAGVEIALERRVAEALRQKLEQDVLVGWTHAEGRGSGVIMQTAMDFKDYVRQLRMVNKHSYNRVEYWHGFVDEFMAAAHLDLLVFLFDDTDLKPQAGQRIIQDIAEYLSHPRIATVVAADLYNLETLMVKSSMIKEDYLDLYEKRAEFADYIFAHSVEKVGSQLLKTFPLHFRFDLMLRDRRDIDGLLGINLSALSVTMALRDWQVAAGAGSGHPLRQRGMQWWLVNAAYSALLTESLRNYIAFLHRMLRGEVDDRKRLEALRAPDGAIADFAESVSIVDAVLGLSYASDLRMRGLHREQDLDGLNPEAYGRQDADFGLHGIYVDYEQEEDSKDISDAILSENIFARSIIELHLDARLAANYLNLKSMSYFGNVLPRNLNFGCQTIWHDDEKNKVGVAGYWSSAPMPRNCLYLYQLRYILTLRRKFQRHNLNIYLPSMAVTAESLRDYSEGTPGVRPNLEVFKEYFTEVYQLVRAQFGTRDIEGLLSLIVGEKKTRISSSAVHPETLARFAWGHVLLYRLHANIRTVPGFKDGYKIILLGEVDNSAQRFVRDMARHAQRQEEQRQFYRVMWNLALHLGYLGTDYLSLRFRTAPIEHGLPFEPNDHAQLRRMIGATLEILSASQGTVVRSLRTRVLLAWAVCPIADQLQPLGCGPDETAAEALGLWRDLAGALLGVASELEAVIGVEESAPPPVAWSIVDRIPLHQPPPDKRAEAYLQTAWQRRQWHFPDFEDAKLREILADCQRAADSIDRQCAMIADDIAAAAYSAAIVKAVVVLFGIGEVPALALLRKMKNGRGQAE